MMELVDEPNVLSPRRSPLAVIQSGHILTLDFDGSAISHIQEACDMQQRRFASAGWGDQGHDLAFSDRQIGTLKHLNLIGFARVV